jgi:hypothetical protein
LRGVVLYEHHDSHYRAYCSCRCPSTYSGQLGQHRYQYFSVQFGTLQCCP